MALVVAGCTSESVNEVMNNNEQQDVLVPVTVSVGGFSVSQEELPTVARTRATSAPADYSGVKALTLAFYKADGTTQAYCTTQLKADDSTYDTFGQFSLSLPVGNYKMIVLGYGSEKAVKFNSMTDVVFDEEKARETFAYTQDVVIGNSAAVDLSATLSRIMSRLCVYSSDERTAEVAKLRVSVSKGGQGFNPITGLATSDAGFNVLIEPNTPAGEVSKSMMHFFLIADEETMDVTIETLDASDNVLFSQVVKDVPFKRNYGTVLTGKMYTVEGSASGTFQVETDWDGRYDINF